MRYLKGFIHLLATPVFWGLAALLYVNPASGHGAMAEHMAMMGVYMGPSPLFVFGYKLPEAAGAIINSMWLMYAMMGLFHLAPWFDLVKDGRKSST